MNNIEIYNRVFEVMQTLQVNPGFFADKLGVRVTDLENFKKSYMGVPMELINKISIEFNVNKDWILTGKGEMFKNSGNI